MLRDTVEGAGVSIFLDVYNEKGSRSEGHLDACDRDVMEEEGRTYFICFLGAKLDEGSVDVAVSWVRVVDVLRTRRMITYASPSRPMVFG